MDTKTQSLANQPKLTGHTPGTWMPTANCACILVFDDAGTSKRVATLNSDEDLFPPSERKANARLIAAAPELLEACKEAEADLLAFNVEDVNVLNVERVGELRGMLLAAIAKAQGLSPDSAASTQATKQ